MKPAQNASAAPLAEGALLPDEGGHQRSSEDIRGHPRPSEAIRGHQRYPRWSSEVIRALSLWKARSSSLV